MIRPVLGLLIATVPALVVPPSAAAECAALTAIRSARTTADIVAIVRHAIPDTATLPSSPGSAEAPERLRWTVLLMTGLLGLIAGARRAAGHGTTDA